MLPDRPECEDGPQGDLGASTKPGTQLCLTKDTTVWIRAGAWSPTRNPFITPKVLLWDEYQSALSGDTASGAQRGCSLSQGWQAGR